MLVEMSHISSKNIFCAIVFAFCALAGLFASDAMAEESAYSSQEKEAIDENKCQTFVMKNKDYYFNLGASQLSSQERKKLKDDFRKLAASVEDVGAKIKMSVEGYCNEAEGSQEECDRLGKSRIEQMKKVIMTFGVKDENIMVITYGNMNYNQSRNTPENRRVRLFIMLCQ